MRTIVELSLPRFVVLPPTLCWNPDWHCFRKKISVISGGRRYALRIALIFPDSVHTESQRLLPGGKNTCPTFVLHRNSDNFHNTVRSKRRLRNFWRMFLNEVDRNCRPFHRKSCLADTVVDFFSAISCNWSCSQVLHCYGFEIRVIKVTSLKLCDVNCFRFFSVDWRLLSLKVAFSSFNRFNSVHSWCCAGIIGGPTFVIWHCFVFVVCGGCVASIYFSCFRQSGRSILFDRKTWRTSQQEYHQQLRVVYIASCLTWAWSCDVSQCLFTFSDLSYLTLIPKKKFSRQGTHHSIHKRPLLLRLFR